jgi:hypothetical protein
MRHLSVIIFHDVSLSMICQYVVFGFLVMVAQISIIKKATNAKKAREMRRRDLRMFFYFSESIHLLFG